MKLKMFFLMLFVTVLLGACSAAPTSNAVQLPDALKPALSGLILAAVTLGLQVVFDSIGLDLRGVGSAIAIAVSGFAIAQLQGLVDIIPAQYDQLVMIVLNIVIVILSGLGTIRAVTDRDRAAQVLAKK
jgi:uncharacterized protein YceK